MQRHSKLKKLVIFFMAVLQLILLSACGSGSPGNSEELETTSLIAASKGNTIGNLRNSGLIASDNYYIFYMTFIGLDGTLNRRNMTSGESRAIANRFFVYLNVVDGFIYYVDFDSNGDIYRMDINGEQHERLSSTWVHFLFVLNDTIYAVGNYLFAMNLDGSDVRILSENSIHSIYFYDNKIYYTTTIDGRVLLYRMGIRGENRERILRNLCVGSEVFVYLGNIYIFEYHGLVTRFNTSTRERIELHSIDEGVRPGSMNRKGNIIFYSSAVSHTYYTLNLDTGEIISVPGIEADLFHVIGDRIFFYDRGTNERIYSMNIDGSDVRRFH